MLNIFLKAEFYRLHGNEHLQFNGVKSYMKYADNKLREEEQRAQRYLEGMCFFKFKFNFYFIYNCHFFRRESWSINKMLRKSANKGSFANFAERVLTSYKIW